MTFSLNEKIFPITYSTHQITQEQFLLAIEKLMQKFDITKERAAEITEDIIKAMILENKPACDLELDQFCIMPNHIHGIIVINNSVGAPLAVALGKTGCLW